MFANLQGHLCEGTGTNLFYVVDGELRTPTLASGCLAGITRRLVLDWYGATEVDAPLDDVVQQASEVFVASTTRDVQAVHRWDDRELDAPGPVTARGAQGVARARGRAARLVTPANVEGRWRCATVGVRTGDWRSGSALRSHRRGHWFEPSIAHPIRPQSAVAHVVARLCRRTEEVTGSSAYRPRPSVRHASAAPSRE